MLNFLIPASAPLLSGMLQSRGARKAADQQAAAAGAGIAEQQRQFDELRRLLQPYVDAGQPAMAQQQALLGLSGTGAQQQAISQIEGSPLMQALMQQGENAMLQNASATGGLRGGNLQGALAQFRPAMLQQMIDQQYSRLGGFTTMGQNAAAGVGMAGMNTGQGISNLLQQQGAARAGGTLGSISPFTELLNMPMQFAGMQAGMGRNPFGGAVPPSGMITGGSGLRLPGG